MKRVYFLAPNIATPQKIVDELRYEGVKDHLIHKLILKHYPAPTVEGIEPLLPPSYCRVCQCLLRDVKEID